MGVMEAFLMGLVGRGDGSEWKGISGVSSVLGKLMWSRGVVMCLGGSTDKGV